MSTPPPSTRSLAVELGLFRDREHLAYQAVPADDQEKRALRALEELCDELNGGGASRGPLSGPGAGDASPSAPPDCRVRIHLVRNLMVSPLLVGFALLPLEGGGEDEPFHYALVVNQPVEIQVASVLDFLSELVERRGYGLGCEASRLEQTLAADEAVNARTVDRMRYGWRETARTLRRRASDTGLRLDLRCTPVFSPTSAGLQDRLSHLAGVYDQVEPVRRVVDRIVAATLSHQVFDRALVAMARRGGCLMESITHHHVTQAVRDALVLGNGYLAVFRETPPSLRNLRPDRVEPRPGGELEVWTESGTKVLAPDQVIHLTGFEQVGAAPGLAVTELFLPGLLAADGARLAAPSTEGDEDSVGEAEDALARRVDLFLGWWLRHLPPPPLDLYFAGQARVAA